MRTAHLLRKYNPAEWGGTETALRQLVAALRLLQVDSVIYSPQIPADAALADPLRDEGHTVKRFRACVPAWGLSPERRRQMIALSGNLLSFDLIGSLWREPNIEVIHSHALGRLGGIGLTVARRRRIPFVVTVHGGVYDLPAGLARSLNGPETDGVDWGKCFGLLLRSRRVLIEADAILTCNPREAELIREHHPDRRVVVQPHSVPALPYRCDHRAAALEAFPQIRDREVLLMAGRIDPVKNQGWLVAETPELIRRHPQALVVLAGAETDGTYATQVRREIARLGLADRVLLTGRLPPCDPRLIGLLQTARAVVVPSLSETFGLVILEAWAAGTPVISSRTSGAGALIEHGQTGWLFDLETPGAFHDAVGETLARPDWRARAAAAGRQRIAADYDAATLAGRLKQLYGELIEEKHALRHSA